MKRGLIRILVLGVLAGLLAVRARAELTVATLHPLLTDLAEQVGGDRVKVRGIVRPGTEVHQFSPSTQDMKELSGAALVLASGKKLENYLGKLRDNLLPGTEILEVGNAIPSLQMSEAMALLENAGPEHGGHVHGGVDPHWWNSVENMERAARVVASAFARKDPDHAAEYDANAAAYLKKLEELGKWARREISRIPPGERKLATAHLSLGYFAKEFGFRLIPVQGLNPEVPATSRDLAGAVDTIRKNRVRAVFPEQSVNPKLLAQISAETGVVFGGELVTDGNGTGPLATFTGAFEHNVNEIVKAIAGAASP